MTMQTPELLLSELNKALRELRAAARVLNENSLDTVMFPVMRRLALAQVMGEEWLIAVGGTQSAGKTTLVRTLYGLRDDDPWLPDNEGQGETLPILIEEVEGLDEPQGYAKMLVPSEDDQRQFDFKLKEIESGEFVDACRGRLPQVLLPVLRVPRRHFYSTGQSLLLLPGYEKRTAGNASWQDLMRQALIGATGCVVVTDATRLADKSQQEILRDMLANELRTVRPIVVVTKTEGLAGTPECLDELRRSAIEVFQLEGEDAARRVVCAGIDAPGTERYSQAWMPDFGAMLRDMSLSGAASRQAQLARLEQTLAADLGDVLREVRTQAALFARSAHGEGGVQETVDACLAAFDEARAALAKEYQSTTAAVVGKHYSDAWKCLEKRLVEQHEGILNKIVNTFNTVTETQSKIEQDVLDSWGRPGALLQKYTAGLGELTASVAGPEHPVTTFASGAPAQRLGYVDSSGKAQQAKFTTEKVQANLRALMLSQAGEVSPGTNRELERTARMLPAMALEYMRIAAAVPELVRVDAVKLRELPQADLNRAAANIKQQFNEFSDTSRSILKGIAAVMAVDVAADGHADIIDVLVRGGTAGGSGPAAAGMTIGGAVTAVVAIGYLAHSALQEVRRYDGQVRGLANSMLQNTRDHHLLHFTARFEQVMDLVRARLREGLRQRYGLDQRLVHQDRLAKALADVFTLQQELLSHLAASGRTLALFDRDAA
jgi:signal recognition particle receptor subunit beta